MSVREKAWVVHGVIMFVLLTVVGTWAFEVVRNDTGFLKLGGVLAFAGVSAVVVHGLITTVLVVVWGRRPAAVIGMHMIGFAIAALVMMATCGAR